MSPRAFITILLSLMVNAVLFGVGAILVLSVPALSEQAKYLLPIVVVASFIVTPFIAWTMAPRLRARYWADRHPAHATRI